MEKIRVGIMGAGRIATSMVAALAPLQNAEVLAIGSRTQEKADAFAEKYNIPRAYGSYEALVSDKDIDLIYIATPHSHHYPCAMLAIDHGKAVLVEKSFTANAREARQLIEHAHAKGVFLTEAIWTRYMPLSLKVKELMDSGIIGTPHILYATLCYNLLHKERLFHKELCGGSLLDLGVYVLNFARMYFGTDITRTVTTCQMDEANGVDLQQTISLMYADGKIANLQSGVLTFSDREGIICGEKGYIRIDNVNCPEQIDVVCNNELVETYTKASDMVNGYEYQVLECKRCLEEGLTESPLMPHAETIAIMEQMDALRKEWGVVYPMDEV